MARTGQKINKKNTRGPRAAKQKRVGRDVVRDVLWAYFGWWTGTVEGRVPWREAGFPLCILMVGQDFTGGWTRRERERKIKARK